MSDLSIFPHFDVKSTMPKVKHFDEAQVYAAGVRASKLMMIEQEARAALRRGDQVTLMINGVPVVTLE